MIFADAGVGSVKSATASLMSLELARAGTNGSAMLERLQPRLGWEVEVEVIAK
jgi:hypothetical protein